jgi:arylsulfatase A-like enzyme
MTLFIRPLRSAGPPNVILLTVDTLRADRLGCYGYGKNTSPNIDGLVKKGVLFTDASANVPLTGPGFASLLTSKYPHQIGAIRNGIPMVDGVPTLATIFQSRGYHTAAVISNWPLKRHLSNLHNGFDLYDDDFHEKRWLFFNAERVAEGVTELTIESIESNTSEPFFAWIHYSDPHAPYLKHKGFEFKSGGINSSNYDSEVAYTDHHIGELLKKLEASGLLSRSLLIFTADHGEALGEHNYTGHGRNLYQPGMHVPFVLLGPGIPEGVREDAKIQLLDLAPTILSYAGIEVPDDMRGLDLMPFVKGVAGYPARSLYLETYPGAAPRIEGAEKMLNKPIWVGFRRGMEKTLFSVRYQKWESYDLASDPGETKSSVKLRDPEFIEKSDRLLAWYGEWEDKAVVGKIDVMTKEDRARFKALGYVDGP